MQARLAPLLLAALAVAGCQRRGEISRTTIAESLKGVLVYPRSRVISMSSGDSAGQLTLSTPAGPDEVARWFRLMLSLNHWDLQSDSRQPDGSVLMYAERVRQPLWIRIQETTGAPGTTYSVTGAIVGSQDTAGTAPADSAQRSGSSMSSKRIHRR